jgi:integrase
MSLKLYKSSSWWYADLVEDGQRKSFNLQVKAEGRRPVSLRERSDADFEASRKAAKKAHDELKRSLADDRNRRRMIQRLRDMEDAGSMLLSELPPFMAAHLESLGRSAAYVQSVKSTVEEFVGALPCKKVEQVNASMVRKWWVGLSGSPRTRNRKKQTIQMTFRELVAGGYLDVSPARGLRSAKMSTEHREPFTDAEIEAMLKVAGDLKPLLIVCMTTALRRSDAASLDWCQVDLKAGWVKVQTQKTNEIAEVPLAPVLREILPPEKSSGPVFPKIAAMRLDRLTKRFAQIRKKAGVSGRKDFHSFRVTWITKALSAGVPMEMVRRVTGHNTVDVVIENYFRPGREHLHQALSILNLYSEPDLKEKVIALVNEASPEQLAAVLAVFD